MSGKREERNVHTVLVGKHEEKRLLGNIRLCRGIILKRILNMIEWHGLDSSSSGYGQMAGCCENGDETLGSKKCGKFVDYLRTC